MAQERRNPLPPGRYWIAVTSRGNSELDHFRQWAAANPSRVKVERSEPIGGGTSNGAFFIFSIVRLPVTFDVKQFGFPNVAGDDIQSAADTVQRPPVPTPASVTTDALGDIFGGITRALDAFDPRAKVVLAIGALYLLTRDKKR
jgi:hypothetical protein